jgi:hypothetical protein
MLVAEYIHKHFPQKKIGLYNSLSKSSDLKNISVEWSSYDILIYTPTILAGVSYILPHYTHAFCFWNNRTTDVHSSIQMMRRVRDISSGEFYHYFEENASDTEIDDNCVYTKIIDTLSIFKTFVTELPQLVTDITFKLYNNVKLSETKSRANFLQLFINELKLMGGVVVSGEEPVANPKELDRELKSITKLVDLETATKICNAPELYNITGGNDATPDDPFAQRKLSIRIVYRYDGPVTPAWIQTYSKLKVLCQYRRRLRLQTSFDGEDPVKFFIDRFFIDVKNNLEVKHIRDLFKRSRDLYAKILLDMFGLEIGSTKVMSRKEVLGVLTLHYPWFVDNYVKMCNEYGSDIGELPKLADDGFLQSMLKIINGKIETQYGVKLIAQTKKNQSYKLEDTFLELFNPNFTAKPPPIQ